MHVLSAREDQSPVRHASSSAGFFLQLWISVQRIFLMSRRRPISFGFEVLVPLIFVSGSVVLWALLSNAHEESGEYFSASSIAQSKAFYSSFSLGMCYTKNAVANLLPCSLLESIVKDQSIEDLTGTIFQDYGSSLTIPNNITTRFLCASDTSGAPDGVCGLELTGYLSRIGWQRLVTRNSSLIPSFDELIPLKWMNRIFYDRTRFRYLSSNSFSSAIHASGTLYFAPASSDTTELVRYLSETYTYFPFVYGGTFSTVSEAESKVKDRDSNDPPIWGIIQVNELHTNHFDVEIRLNNSALPLRNTALVTPYAGGVPSGDSAMYILSGFSTLQQTIYEYFTTVVQNTPSPSSSSIAVVPAPTSAYEKHLFLTQVATFGPLIIVFGFLYPVSQMSKRMVLDKELRIREAMLIMGLSRPVMYLSWLVIYGFQFFFISIGITLLMKLTYLEHANAFILFLCLYLFCLSTVALSGLISSFFSRSRVASIVAPLIFFATSIPLFAMNGTSPTAKGVTMVLSPSALSVGIQLFFNEELNGGFVLNKMTSFNPSMLLVLIMLCVDFFLYGVLMVYFDFVLPQDFGTRRHPLFFILDPFRWCCGRQNNDDDASLEDGRHENGIFESSEDAASHSIQIKGLRKTYKKNGKKMTAVNNFYWSMKEGEISVLLGHNGAGKTTLLNMMTGMIEADAGDTEIYGHSVRHHLSDARKEIGFCPQHNILWPDLTCYEHLWFYGSIKGQKGKALQDAIVLMLKKVELLDKLDCLASQLSGGQKRKLSVAIAFVGGSRFVFLDEPTAGMDVNARHSTWDLLRILSNDHSILLTTHFMDEADLLGDSVAIMNNGRLHCSGSNFFLKSHLGLGYLLTLSVSPSSDNQAITAFIFSQLPEVKCLGSTAGEVLFRIPMNERTKFPFLMSSIEDAISSASIGITGYSLSASTLEEIFIHIVEEERQKIPSMMKENDDFAGATVWDVALLQTTASLRWSQFKAQLIKRLWNALRDRRTQFFQLACPLLCVLLAMLIMLIPFFDTSRLELSSNIYNTPVAVDVVNCNAFMNPSLSFSSLAKTHTVDASTVEELNTYLNTSYFNHPFGRPRYSSLYCGDAKSNDTSYIFYNSSAYHEVGVGLFNLYNGYYQKSVGSNSKLKTTVHCMPPTKKEKNLTTALYAMTISIIIMIPFTFIPSTFVGWIVREKQCGARHLQNVSGLSFYIYWLTNFLFDIVCYIITMLLVICVFLIFKREEYVSSETIGPTLTVLFLYGVSGILMSYVLSFFFLDYSSAQNAVLLGNFITGFLLVLVVAVLSFINETKNTANTLRWIFRIIPSFCVGEGILNIAQNFLIKAIGGEVSIWGMNSVGWPCVYMAIEAPIFLFVVFFVDHPGRRQRAQRLFYNSHATIESMEDEEEDVKEERAAVLSEERETDLVSVKELRKVYENGKVAVRNASFGVQPGEVFGFLGTNGAGKTTTISMLCQEVYPSSGRAAVCGYDIVEESSKALQCIGYCPQFDATIDLLTTEEHLWLYAGIRGIAYTYREEVIRSLLSLFQLHGYKNVLSQSLSGGNRRKLSVAISLIGGPRVVFLDEPSAGMDPVARRGLWSAIKSVSSNCSVVLTTHHLEEVEALAHRVGIMVDGSLRCIGNKTHLKNKYGKGFEITVRVESDDDVKKKKVSCFFEECFPDSTLEEYRARRFIYSVPQSTKLSSIFSLLEANAASLPITDYSVSQASIEAVFLRISANAANTEDDESKKCCSCC